MPAYEYECLSCESHFDLRQKMSDPELASCPRCGGAVHRLISGGAGVLSRGGAAAPAPAACGAGQACCMSQSPCASGACAWEN